MEQKKISILSQKIESYIELGKIYDDYIMGDYYENKEKLKEEENINNFEEYLLIENEALVRMIGIDNI